MRALFSWIAAFLPRREFLPNEFANDPAIANATLHPVDEMWRQRLRLLCPPPKDD
jgi:hypothetical protein